MNIKVGQWVRKYDNTFEKVAPCLKGYYEVKPYEYKGVADTPQELVQVGDLAEYLDYIDDKNYIIKVACVEDIEFLNLGNIGLVAIYTPNADKTQYTEQWRKDND